MAVKFNLMDTLSQQELQRIEELTNVLSAEIPPETPNLIALLASVALAVAAIDTIPDENSRLIMRRLVGALINGGMRCETVRTDG